jgi:5-methylcytosine-specific restriction endonuclease McrA
MGKKKKFIRYADHNKGWKLLKEYCVRKGHELKHLTLQSAAKIYCQDHGLPIITKKADIYQATTRWFADQLYKPTPIPDKTGGKFPKEYLPEKKPKTHLEIMQQKWYYDPNNFYCQEPWLRLKRRIIGLYGNTCMKCQKKTSRAHVDHIKPRSKFPALELDPSNLQVLCRDCNMEKLNHHSTDYRPQWAINYNWSTF